MKQALILGSFLSLVVGATLLVSHTVSSNARSDKGVRPIPTQAAEDNVTQVTFTFDEPSMDHRVPEGIAQDPSTNSRFVSSAALGEAAERINPTLAFGQSRGQVASRLGVLEDSPVAIDRGILVHPSASIDEKLDALMRLDASSFLNSTTTLDKAAEREVFWLLANVEDPELKEKALQGLEHYRGEVLLDPVLAILRNDSNASTRKQAADMLKEHLGQPHVYRALLQAAQDDKDPEVRREASLAR